MKILVTGGAGFIGSHTVVELIGRGYEPVIVDNFCNSKSNVIENIEKITGKKPLFYNIDITNFDLLENVFKVNKFDAVIHFAALKSGADSIINPGLYYFNNIESTHNIVRLMEKYSVKKLVFSSSATVYGNCSNVPIKENEKIGDVTSPYGMTKYLDELYLKNQAVYGKKIKVIALRYFNPIGAHPSGFLGEDSPFDVPNNLMLYVLKVAKKELPYLNIYGNDYRTIDGTGLRDYIHVVDLAKGHLAALSYLDIADKYFDVFNLGTGKGHTVIEFVKTFEDVNKVHIPFKLVERRPGDVEISYASCKKANKLLKWEAKKSLSDCLIDAWKFANNNH